MGELLKVVRTKAWSQLSLQEKQLRLKAELLEEMVAMANQLRLQLSIAQIMHAIEQTDYSPEEIEEQHRVHGHWSRASQHRALEAAAC